MTEIPLNVTLNNQIHIQLKTSLDINTKWKRELENQLNELIDTKSEGAQTRSLANWRRKKYQLLFYVGNEKSAEQCYSKAEYGKWYSLCSFYEQ